MNVLIVAIEDERMGPVRLAKFLQGAGLKVAVLSGKNNPLFHTRYVDKRFCMPSTRNWKPMAAAIEKAINEWKVTYVIPSDEQVFALLVELLDPLNGSKARVLTDASRQVLLRSLGSAETLKLKLSKNAGQRLARSIGVRCAPGDSAASKAGALRIASELGFPVIAKKSFGWSGAGVRVCRNSSDIEQAFDDMAPGRRIPIKDIARRLMGRDWYPAVEELWIQKKIEGVPAMYTFVAHKGRILAGFSSIKRLTVSANGPSSVIDCEHNAELSEASAKLAAAMGSVGFNSFDFMIEAGSNRPYFLECNPRPNPVSHLGAHLGVDFCQHLTNALSGDGCSTSMPPEEPTKAQTIALFPQEWRREANSPHIQTHFHDVPWEDRTLVAHLMKEVLL
jgi:biotin carboxylase